MSTHPFCRSAATVAGFLCAVSLILVGGCEKSEPIVTYRVPTALPAQLRVGNQRMLAAMVPSGDQVWFFKVTGPESAIALVDSDFRNFVENVQIEDGKPVLEPLPSGWTRGGEKAMRFASIDVDTPEKQLDISISQLGRQEDYDAFVAMNVNRWRNQLALEPSDDDWAGADSIEVAAADGKSVWVDLVGQAGASAAPMTPPFAGSAPFAGGAGPFAGGAGPSAGGAGTAANDPPPMIAAPPSDDSADRESPIQFERPEGWRDGKQSSMRLAAFNVGPEDAPAEITVIPAGGDLRGNIARWLGQIREGKVPDKVVDDAVDAAAEVDVDGRAGQRFLLLPEDVDSGTAIDATIVPLDGGMSLFIKMTGPAKTVSDQDESIQMFLNSLKLSL